MKLSPLHHRILNILVEYHQTNTMPMKCEEIAKKINLSNGHIRNYMLALKNLKLIKSIAGPKGGYIPTDCVYEKLYSSNNKNEKLQIYHNNKLSKVLLQEIILKPPNKGILHVTGNIHNFGIGDKIHIASIKLIFRGVVVERDDTNNSLICSIELIFFRK